ncbi:MAG: LPS export ABC transporter permease LptG [Bdellovibrionota bacterium]
MALVDRWLSKLFITYFVGGLIVFITLFLAVDALSTMVSAEGLPLASLIKYYWFYLPEIIQKMLPVACLLGMVMTLSSLNKQNELVALFASGMSLFRIVRGPLILIVVISMGFYWAGDRVMPSLNKKKNFIYYNEIKKAPGMYSIVKTNKIWYRSKNAIFNIKTISSDGLRAQGITLYFFNEAWDLVQMMSADEVNFKGNTWNLKDGSVTLFTPESSFPLTKGFEEKTIVMTEESQDLQSTAQTSDLLSQKELSRFITKNKDAGLDTIRYEVDYHVKMSFAFAGLVMSLLGIPFSVGRTRSGGNLVNMGMGLGLVFFYWVFYSSGQTLGYHGTLPPFVAAWLPNLVMIGLAAILLSRSKK